MSECIKKVFYVKLTECMSCFGVSKAKTHYMYGYRIDCFSPFLVENAKTVITTDAILMCFLLS